MTQPTHADERRAALAAESDLPLYVDLDGSLVRSDLLVESALKYVKGSLRRAPDLLRWLARGKAVLKDGIARRVELRADLLPYNDEVVALARGARSAGRRVVLATASHRRYAEAVAAHLGIFDAVLATGPDVNLGGTHKLAAIHADAGGGPFEYVGNERVDLPIWRESAAAVVVGGSPALRRRAALASPIVRHVDVPAATAADWLRAMRLHQWAKNLLVLMPAMPLVAEIDASAWIALLIAFLCFGLCASSVYLLNDLLDLEADRSHARKRFRPIPAGRLPVFAVLAAVPALLAAAFVGAAALLPWGFVAVLGVYWLSTLAYSFELKRRVLSDIMTLAGLYTLRLIAGSAVLLVAPSFWILAFSIFLFLSLAAAKRYVELSETQRRDGAAVAGRGYHVTDIPFVLSLGVASGFIAVLVFALYVNDPSARAHLRQPVALWGVCPLLLYWIARVWLKATRGELHDDPVVFAVSDRISRVVAVLSLVLLAWAARG
jgi:4-hydroxybenzoate polyprenyltransferase